MAAPEKARLRLRLPRRVFDVVALPAAPLPSGNSTNFRSINPHLLMDPDQSLPPRDNFLSQLNVIGSKISEHLSLLGSIEITLSIIAISI